MPIGTKLTVVTGRFLTTNAAGNLGSISGHDDVSTIGASEGKLLEFDSNLNLVPGNKTVVVDALGSNSATEAVSVNQATLLNQSKLGTGDIVNDLVTNDTSKVLGADQGVVLKSLIDSIETDADGLDTRVDALEDTPTFNSVTLQNPTTPANESIIRADIGAGSQKLLMYGKSTEANGAWVRVIGEDDPTSPNEILMGYGGSPNPQFTIEGDELQYIRRDGTNKLIATQDDVETVESITFQNSVNPLNESIIRADTGADAQTLLLFGKSASTDGAWIQLVGEDDTTDTNQLLMGYGGNSNSQFTISGDELQYIRRDGVNKLIATQDDVATVNDITFQNPTTPTNESIVRADVGTDAQKILVYGKSTEANGAWVRVIGEDDPVSPNEVLMGVGGVTEPQLILQADGLQYVRRNGTQKLIATQEDVGTVNSITLQNPTTIANESIIRADLGADTQKVLLYGKSTELNGAWVYIIGEDDTTSASKVIMGVGGSTDVQFELTADELQRIRRNGALHQILSEDSFTTNVNETSTTKIHPTSVTSNINDGLIGVTEYVASLPVPLTQGAAYTGKVDEFGTQFRVHNGTGAVAVAVLEAAIGMTPGTLSGLGYGTVTEGSAYTDRAYINAGDTFSFNWDWSTNEVGAEDFWFAFLTINATELVFDFQPADGATGTFSWVATESGLLSYSVGAVDTTDASLDSWVIIDTFSPAAVIPNGWTPVNVVTRDNEADAFTDRYTFDQTLTEDTEHTIGASGTTATNIWSDMNDLPSGTYDITIRVFVDVTASGSPEYDLKVYCANDDAGTIDAHNIVGSVNGTTNFKNSSVGEFKVRVTDRVFRLKWSELLGVSVTFTGSLSLVGFSLEQ
jgi:hypothetical protein